MSPALIVGIVDGLLALSEAAFTFAANVSKIESQGGELTPEQREDLDARIIASRGRMDAMAAELEALATED